MDKHNHDRDNGTITTVFYPPVGWVCVEQSDHEANKQRAKLGNERHAVQAVEGGCAEGPIVQGKDEKGKRYHRPGRQLAGHAWLDEDEHARHQQLPEHLNPFKPPAIDTVCNEEETKTADDLLVLGRILVVILTVARE
jgi:hypothetical protein